MPTVAVVGAQWGDEGKAGIVDLLAADADWVVRFQGGPNAGHTVVVGESTFKLHLVPSGMVRPEPRCLIAQGVVLDPTVLFHEMEMLEAAGVRTTGRLSVSDRAHLIMPWHRILDGLRETRDSHRIGTTRRGIGPCYADKVSYRGLRIADLMEREWFEERVRVEVAQRNVLLSRVYDEPEMDVESILAEFAGWRERLRPLVTDGGLLLAEALAAGETVLFEGAQGFLLDVDAGTYPFVTGSNASPSGIPAGAGIPPRAVGRTIGIAKAYCTRVGDGPFPTEDHGETGEAIRQAGREFGTTTGRPRRCGWFDAVAVRYAHRASGYDELAITKLDILAGLPVLRLGVAYERAGRQFTEVPACANVLEECEVVYEEFPGFTEDITGIRRFEDLPGPARDFLCAIEDRVGVPVRIVSVGPERDQVIRRD